MHLKIKTATHHELPMETIQLLLRLDELDEHAINLPDSYVLEQLAEIVSSYAEAVRPILLKPNHTDHIHILHNITASPPTDCSPPG